MRKSILKAITLFYAMLSANAQTIDFEHLNTLLGFNKSWNGSGKSIESNITSGGVNLKTSFTKDVEISYWSEWTVSKVKNTTLAGLSNDRAAITYGGFENSTNYAIGYGSTNILKFKELVTVNGFQITNGTYPYLSMRDGDGFAKKFGGASGTDPDYFLVTINGFQNGILNTIVGISVYLADFRSNISQEDFILSDWKSADLSSLGGVDSLKFELKSSDNGVFGMNTPAYIVLDNISTTGSNFFVADFENYTLSGSDFFKAPNTTFTNTITSGIGIFKNSYSYFGDYDYDSWTGFAFSKVNNTVTSGISNQFASAAGKGFGNSTIYAIAYKNSEIFLNSAQSVSGMYATNTTYAHNSMRDGDSFAKKFGGTSGTEPDYFIIIVKGFRNGVFTDSTTHYLADYRSSISGEDFISSTWQWVDLSKLGIVDRVSFSFRSSDSGRFGINTPQYFALDNFNGVAPINTSVSNNEYNSKLTTSIFPNPAKSEFSVTGIESDFDIELYSNIGVLVYKNLGNKFTKFDISHLQSGIYMIKILDRNNKISFQKIVIE